MVLEVSGGAVGLVSPGEDPLATPCYPGSFPACVEVKNRYFEGNSAKI